MKMEGDLEKLLEKQLHTGLSKVIKCISIQGVPHHIGLCTAGENTRKI